MTRVWRALLVLIVAGLVAVDVALAGEESKGSGTPAGAKQSGQWQDPAAGFDAMEKAAGHDPLKGELTKEEFVKVLEETDARMGKWASQLFDQATKADPKKITKDEWVGFRKKGGFGQDPAARFDALEKAAGHEPLKGELTRDEFVKALEKSDSQMGKWANQLFDQATKADPTKITKDEWVKFRKEAAGGEKKTSVTPAPARKGGAWQDPAAGFDAMERAVGHEPLKGELTKDEFITAMEKSNAQMAKWASQLFDRADKADPAKITKDEWVKSRKEAAGGGKKSR